MGDTSPFDSFHTLFPNCERELINLPRRFHDSDNNLENDPLVRSVLSGSNLFLELHNLNLKGFFISDLRKLLEKSVEEPDMDPTQKRCGHGCIYVPMPLSGNIFVFKNVSKVEEDTVKTLVESLKDQLKFIHQQLESPIHVHLMLTCSKELFNNIRKKVKLECNFTFVYLNFKNIPPKAKKTIDHFKCQPRPVHGLKRLIEKVFEHGRLTQKFELSEELFKHFGGKPFSFSEHEDVLSLFKVYFPKFDTHLQIIPDVNRIKDCLLYSTNEKAMFSRDKVDESMYLGEVKWFLDKFIPSLQSPSGVMIKNWDNFLFKKILSSNTPFKTDFEHDYLMCCKNNLIVFEIGATENPQLPETTVKNKLKQCITKIQPTLKVVANILLQRIPDSWFDSLDEKRSRIQNFTNCNLKVVVYLPNALIDGFKTVMGKDTVKEFIKTLIPSAEQAASLNQLYFVMPKHHVMVENHNRLQMVTFKLNSNMEIEEVGDPQLVLDSVEDTCEKLTQYLFATISFSKLKCNVESKITEPDTSPLDIDERYRETRNRLRKTKDSRGDPNFLDIILSPQQQSILELNDPRVWISGEPGSGKTALLLAKAILEAKKQDVRAVLYCIPKKKRLLRNFVSKELEKYNDNWTKKIFLVAFGENSKTNLLKELNHQMGRLKSCIQSCAVFIDEVYASNLYYLDGFVSQSPEPIIESKIFWLAEVVVGQRPTGKRPSTDFASERGFKQVFLTVLYRNPHHISETATALINEQKGVSASTAVIHGCYTSSQKNIAIGFYSDAEQLPKMLNDMLNSIFKTDEILFVFYCSYFTKNKMSAAEEALESYSNNCYYRVQHKARHDESVYAGCESKCVAMVIDKSCDGIKLNDLIITITRAQYEAVILVDEICKFKYELKKQIGLRAIFSQIHANLKSGSKFIWPEPLSTANIKEAVRGLVYNERSGGGLKKEDWLTLVQSMPTERKEDAGITFADKEDLIVEIIKSSLSSKLTIETLTLISEKEDDLITQQLLKDICQSLSIFTKKPTLNYYTRSVLQEKFGNQCWLRTALRVMWEESKFFTTQEEMIHLEEAMKLMERNGFLHEPSEETTNLLWRICTFGKTDKLELVLETLERYNVLEKNLEKAPKLLSYIFKHNATDKLELVLETLKRYNVLEKHLEENPKLLSYVFEHNAIDKLELVLRTLERYNVLEKHLGRNPQLLLGIIENIHEAPDDKIDFVLAALKQRYKLLQKHLESTSYCERFNLPGQRLTIILYLVGRRGSDVPAVRFLIELGFPNRLLLHKTSEREHVLHLAIKNSKADLVKYLLDDDDRRLIFLSKEEDALFYLTEQSKHMNALEYAKYMYDGLNTGSYSDKPQQQEILKYLTFLFR